MNYTDALSGIGLIACACALAVPSIRAHARAYHHAQRATRRANALLRATHDDATHDDATHALILTDDDATHDDYDDDAPVFATFHDTRDDTRDARADYYDAHDDYDAMPPHYA